MTQSKPDLTKSDASVRAIAIGSGLLAPSLLGYIIYQVNLRPAAGFPSDDMKVILGGINTLRFGHGLKFIEAIAVALIAVGLQLRFNHSTPLLAQLIALLGTGTSALLIVIPNLRLGDTKPLIL